MPTASFDVESPATPEQIREAMLDFTERRPKLWPGLAAKYFEVYSVGETTADIREGTGFPFNVWAKEHYDWSEPDTFAWTVQESNFCAPQTSGVVMKVAPREGGGSIVHIDWRREPTSLKGKMIIPLIARNNGTRLHGFIKQGLDALPKNLAAN